jgi:hypothetical protein
MDGMKRVLAFLVLVAAGWMAWSHLMSDAPVPAPVAKSVDPADAGEGSKQATVTLSSSAYPASTGANAAANSSIKTVDNPAALATTGATGRTSPPMPRIRVTAPPMLAQPSALTKQYVAQEDYAALYQKALAAGDTPESTFLRAQLLSQCGARAGVTPPTAAELDQKRQAYIATLPAGNPDTAARIAAFEAINTDLCGSLRSVATSTQEVNALYAKAVELGDPAARSRQLSCEILGQTRLTAQSAPALSQVQLDELRNLMKSKNPIAIRTVTSLLANNFRNFGLGIGSDKQKINNKALFNTAELLACQYGAPCDEKNRVLLDACVKDGKCGAGNYADHVTIYDATEQEVQLMNQYRAALTNMIETGDFSALKVIPQEQSVESQAYFGSDFKCN